MNCCFQQVLRKFRDEVSKKIKNLPCDEVPDPDASLRDAPSSELPASNSQLPAPSSQRYPLLVYDFDLLVDHLSGKPVDRDVHPIPFFALDNKPIGKTCSIRWVLAALSNHVNQQVPSPRLVCLPESPRDRLAL